MSKFEEILLFKRMLAYISGELITKLIPFLFLPYLTRVLGPDGYGELAYYLALLAFFFIFCNLNQGAAIQRYFYFYGHRSFDLIKKAGLIYSMVITVLVCIFTGLTNNYELILLAICSYFQVLHNTSLSIFQSKEDATSYIKTQLIAVIISSVITILLISFVSKDPLMRIFSLAIGYLIAFQCTHVLLKKSKKREIKITFIKLVLGLKYLFAFGLPLLLNNLAFVLKGQFDRFFIYEYYTKAELGIYAVAFQLASIVPLVLMAVNKALTPYIYKRLKNKQLSNVLIFKYALAALILAPITFSISYILPSNFFVYFFGSDFENVSVYFPIFVFGLSLHGSYLIISNYFFFFGKTKLLTIVNILSTLVYIASIFLLNILGLEFLPFAIFISNIFLVVTLLIVFLVDIKKTEN